MTGFPPPSEADGTPEERQKGMKTKQTFSVDSGQEQGQDNLLPKAVSPSTTSGGLRWKEFHLRAGGQVRYSI